MRWPGRVKALAAPPASVASLLVLLVFGVVIASPAGTAADSAAAWMTASVPLRGTSFSGTPAVGALFIMGANSAATHFCTASVVDSPKRDLVITAAHCLANLSARADRVTFVPGFHDNKAPYGVWTTARVIVDDAWASSADPDDDVAFLIITPAAGSRRIEDVTGAERLSIGPPTGVVRVTGYPNGKNRPITCQNSITKFSARQMRFACAGFTDGTSGGPFLANVSPTTGDGLVVGVVGGYEEGGYTPEISYSPMFGRNVAALYKTAVARG
ncbi:MAG: trypsin-like serine peptidase [Micromonosporaceae bacterium]